MKKKNENPEVDDRLAEFTDRVLAGKNSKPDSSAEDELRDLEETILRLNRALPHSDVDQVSLRHLEAHLNVHLNRKLDQAQIPFWQKWFGRRYGRFRVQGFIAAVVSLFVLVTFLINLLFPPHTSKITATAFTGSINIITLAALAGAVLLALWIGRRK